MGAVQWQARAGKAEELYKWVEVTSNAKVVELVIDGDICMIKASGGHGSRDFHSDSSLGHLQIKATEGNENS